MEVSVTLRVPSCRVCLSAVQVALGPFTVEQTPPNLPGRAIETLDRVALSSIAGDRSQVHTDRAPRVPDGHVQKVSSTQIQFSATCSRSL